EQVGDLLLSLVEKSLVHADSTGDEMRYRLLESTRYYASEKLPDAAATRRQHAQYFAARFAQATAEWETTLTQQWMASYAADVDNLRGALDWAFAPNGDIAIGLDLVSQSHLVWSELGLMLEHRRWVDQALGKIGNKTPAVV